MGSREPGEGSWGCWEHSPGSRRQQESGHVTSVVNSVCLPRPHANPAVSEEGWLLWGLVTPGQQYLVRLGSVFRAARELRNHRLGLQPSLPPLQAHGLCAEDSEFGPGAGG